MAGTPIGGLRVDLQLNSAAFIRDIAKTNQAIATNTRTMRNSLTTLSTTATKVGAAFGAWLTVRSARRVISFLDQSIDLAAKLNSQLGESARLFQRQGEEISNAFKLGVAQGFLDEVSKGLAQSGLGLKQFAEAGIVVGNVLGKGLTAIAHLLTVEIPKGFNDSIASINNLISGYNALVSAREKMAMQPSALAPGAAGSGLIGAPGAGAIPLISPVTIEGQVAAWVDLSSAANVAANATNLAAESQKNLGDSIKTTSDKIIAQLNAMDALRQKQFQASLETTQNWLGVADTVGQALGTMFKENKAVAVAQAVVNTAQAITEAMKLPPPIDAFKIAAVTALGAAQIATIASASPGSSKAIRGGGGGISGAARAGAASRGGGGGSGQSVFVTLKGSYGMFPEEQIRRLIGQLNSAQRDGTRIEVI